jgi:hypothetical protein
MLPLLRLRQNGLAVFTLVFGGCVCQEHRQKSVLPHLRPINASLYKHPHKLLNFNRKNNSNTFHEVERDGLECTANIVVDATENHTATVIWMHSFGDTGRHFAHASELDLPGTFAMPWTRFIFPTACELNLTLHGGAAQPAWFDIARLDVRGGSVAQDAAGLASASARIADLALAEVSAGIPPHRIVLAGFGQVRAQSPPLPKWRQLAGRQLSVGPQ